MTQRIGANYNIARSFGFDCAIVMSKCNNSVVVTTKMDSPIRDIALVEPSYNAHQYSATAAAAAVSRYTCFSINNCKTKIAGKDADVPFECNRPVTTEQRGLYTQWLAELKIHERLITSMIGYNLYIRRTKDRALGERVRCEECSRGPNMIVTLAINQEMAFVHHHHH